jgi:hypothetical protein
MQAKHKNLLIIDNDCEFLIILVDFQERKYSPNFILKIQNLNLNFF